MKPESRDLTTTELEKRQSIDFSFSAPHRHLFFHSIMLLISFVILRSSAFLILFYFNPLSRWVVSALNAQCSIVIVVLYKIVSGKLRNTTH